VEGAEKKFHASQPPDVVEWLEERTFFTEIQRPDWSALRDVLWPASRVEKPATRFGEEEMRARLLSTVARLGHGLIDIYQEVRRSSSRRVNDRNLHARLDLPIARPEQEEAGCPPTSKP
jgi:hypothetical protein